MRGMTNCSCDAEKVCPYSPTIPVPPPSEEGFDVDLVAVGEEE
jgi:hypothetical protein